MMSVLDNAFLSFSIISITSVLLRNKKLSLDSIKKLRAFASILDYFIRERLVAVSSTRLETAELNCI